MHKSIVNHNSFYITKQNEEVYEYNNSKLLSSILTKQKLTKTQQLDALSQSLKTLFISQYQQIYYDLSELLILMFKLWKYDVNNSSQRKFYALLYLFSTYSYCFNPNNNIYSSDSLIYLNFFCFFWYDSKFFSWTGFNLNYSDAKLNQDLALCFKTLNEISARLIMITQYNLADLVYYLKLYYQQKQLGYKVYLLEWDINNIKNYVLPVDVLNEYINSNKAFSTYYFSLNQHENVNGLSSEEKIKWNNIYLKYYALNNSSQLNFDVFNEQKEIILNYLYEKK